MLSWQRAQVCHHLIPHRLGPDGILSGQRGTAEQDEEQDEVGEPGSVDNAMTQDTDPGGGMARGSGEQWAPGHSGLRASVPQTDSETLLPKSVEKAGLHLNCPLAGHCMVCAPCALSAALALLPAKSLLPPSPPQYSSTTLWFPHKKNEAGGSPSVKQTDETPRQLWSMYILKV